MSVNEKLYAELESYVTTRDIPEAEKKGVLAVLPSVFYPVEYVNARVGIDEKTYAKLTELVDAEDFTDELNRIPTLYRSEAELPKFRDRDDGFADFLKAIQERNRNIVREFNASGRSGNREEIKESVSVLRVVDDLNIPLLHRVEPESQEELDKVFARRAGNEALRANHHASPSPYTVVDLSSMSTASGISINNRHNVILVGNINQELTVSGCSNVILQVNCQLTNVVPNNVHYHLPDSICIRVVNSSGVFFNYMDISGEEISEVDINRVLSGIESAHADAIARPRAVRISGCSDVTIMDCYTKYVSYSFDLLASSRVYCQYNIAHYLVSDMFHCFGLENSDILDNYRSKVLAFQACNE